MFKTGLICRKISDKKIGIVLEKKKNTVLLDGELKKKYYNINHLEPAGFADIKKDASHEEVLKVLEAVGFKVKWQKKSKRKNKNKEKQKEK